MRKVIVGATLVVLCMLYFVAVKNQMTEQVSTQSVPTFVRDAMQKWDKEYPATPQEVVEAYHLVMNYQYSQQMIQEDIADTIQAMRELYSQDLLQLNSADSQVVSLSQELAKNQEMGLYITASSIEAISYDEANIAKVIVKYVTTQGEFQRTYMLIEENNKWKITYWENT